MMTSSMSISGETRRSSGALSRKARDIHHGAAGSLVGQMLLLGGNVLLFQQDLVGAAHGDHGFLHPVLHAFDDGGHADQAGDAEDDAQHREQRAELVRPHFLQADDDGVERSWRHSYRSAWMGLSRAAFIAGKIPASMPTSTLNAKGDHQRSDGDDRRVVSRRE